MIYLNNSAIRNEMKKLMETEKGATKVRVNKIVVKQKYPIININGYSLIPSIEMGANLATPLPNKRHVARKIDKISTIHASSKNECIGRNGYENINRHIPAGKNLETA
jgi:hypothetical protein